MRHDFQIPHNSGLIRGSLMPVLAITLFCIFIVVVIFNTFVSTRDYEGELIDRDIKRLVVALNQIEKDCKIYSVESAKNSINFLNVKSFVGSQVGALNLKHPDRWKGPYMDVNPSMQSFEYTLVRTKKGYYVVPGDGVKLPNGKVVGKDILINEDSDIDAMIKDEQTFGSKNKKYAAPLEIKKRGTYFALPVAPIDYAA